MRYKLIVNPVSGNYSTLKALPYIKNCFIEDELDIFVTKKTGDAKNEAKKSKNYDAVIAVGGDGTINEVINGLPKSETLGIIPFGTANVIALEFKIPLNNTKKACDIIKNRKISVIDVGSINDTKFAITAGIGFDAEVVRSIDTRVKKHLHAGIYWLTLIKKLFTFKAEEQIVNIDGKDYKSYFTIIANTKNYGGRYEIAYNAKYDDGELDCILFKRYNAFYTGLAVLMAILGMHKKLSYLKYIRGKKISVSSKQPIPIEIDGDFLGYSPAKIQILPKHLRLITG